MADRPYVQVLIFQPRKDTSGTYVVSESWEKAENSVGDLPGISWDPRKWEFVMVRKELMGFINIWVQ